MKSGIPTLEAARKVLDPREVDVVLYHGKCNDGFGAAFAACKALDSSAIYLPINHDDIHVTDHFPSTYRVLMVDITLAPEEMERIYYRQPAFLVLDHHKTAPDNCGHLASKILYYDEDHSGAHLAWTYFHGEPVPQLIRYLEDRDLWRFELHYSKAINAALQVLPQNFVAWDTVDLRQARYDGEAILRATDVLVRRIAESTANKVENHADGIHFVVCNTPILQSEVGEELLLQFPEASFAATYYRHHDGYNHVSLRSRGDFDVALLARQYGGGGHRAAAGFRTLASVASLLLEGAIKMREDATQ